MAGPGRPLRHAGRDTAALPLPCANPRIEQAIYHRAPPSTSPENLNHRAPRAPSPENDRAPGAPSPERLKPCALFSRRTAGLREPRAGEARNRPISGSHGGLTLGRRPSPPPRRPSQPQAAAGILSDFNRFQTTRLAAAPAAVRPARRPASWAPCVRRPGSRLAAACPPAARFPPLSLRRAATRNTFGAYVPTFRFVRTNRILSVRTHQPKYFRYVPT